MDSWPDEGAGTTGNSTLTVRAAARSWPIYAVLMISMVGLVLAFVSSPLIRDSFALAALSYAAVMLSGCLLLSWRRYEAIRTTQAAGGFGDLRVQPAEKLAILVLALACIALGAVVSYEIAGWSLWF